MANTGLRRHKPAPVPPATMWPPATLNEALARKAESIDGEPSGLVTRPRTLHETPIAEFSPADICFLLGQKTGVEIRLDRALDLLERAALLETEFYSGDLLCGVLSLLMSSLTGNRARYPRILAVANKGLATAAACTEFGQLYVASTSGLSSRMVSTNSTPL